MSGVRLTKNSLDKVGVDLEENSQSGPWFTCRVCGCMWTNDQTPHGGKQRKGWWICPEGECNKPIIEVESD